jgi:hypothetical protein
MECVSQCMQLVRQYSVISVFYLIVLCCMLIVVARENTHGWLIRCFQLQDTYLVPTPRRSSAGRVSIRPARWDAPHARPRTIWGYSKNATRIAYGAVTSPKTILLIPGVALRPASQTYARHPASAGLATLDHGRCRRFDRTNGKITASNRVNIE